MHMAAKAGRLEIAEHLWASSADMELFTRKDEAYLHFAAQAGHLSLMNFFVLKKADPNVATEDGWTPLHIVAHHGHVACMTQLCKSLRTARIDVDQVTNNGQTALHIAGAP